MGAKWLLTLWVGTVVPTTVLLADGDWSAALSASSEIQLQLGEIGRAHV